MMSFLYHRKRVYFALFLLLGLIDVDTVGSAEQSSIIPGKGAAGYRIGDPQPESIKPGVTLLPISGEFIEMIEIDSPLYFLEGSWLRVKEHTREDIIRFYGKPEEKGGPSTLSYPYRGISFVVDGQTALISKIIIYSPKVKKFQIKENAPEIYHQLYKG
jgi:hypothetical protein